MSKTIAILQSNYIPWKGYFDMINMVDEFVVYDEVQFTKNDWRNRNLIKTKDGVQWLTIPCYHAFGQKINEVLISDNNWNKKHWHSFVTNYHKAEYFDKYEPMFKPMYLNIRTMLLTEINLMFIKKINEILNIKAKIVNSADIPHSGTDKVGRLVEICKHRKADVYLSGPKARNYLTVELFTAEDIDVQWMDYSDYPRYEQLHPPFTHQVSIMDLIFNLGVHAVDYMKSFNNEVK